jgi:hypothetical protein
MQKTILAVCAAAALFAMPGVTLAQAVGNGGATYSDVTNKNAWAEFYPNFVTATREATLAQGGMLEALGMGEQAAAVAAQSKEFSRESAPGAVESFMNARTAAGAALAARLATPGLKLEEAKKLQFGTDIDVLARTIKTYESISTDLPYLKTQLRGAGNKGRTGLFVAKSMPNYVRDMKLELAAAIKFAVANGIAFAPEANALAVPAQ